MFIKIKSIKIFVILLTLFVGHPLVADSGSTIDLSVKDMPISQVFEMLSIKSKTNILVGKSVSGNISVNMSDVSLEHAILSIAESAGYITEKRGSTFLILDRAEVGQEALSSNTEIRTFKIYYSKPESVKTILEQHLSRYGKITALKNRKMLIIEDKPEFLDRFQKTLEKIDQKPVQLLIEAKILEISLTDAETFGLDWARTSSSPSTTRSFGTTGFSSASGNPPTFLPGFFYSILSPNINATLSALSSSGRVKTLSTPKILAMENEEANVVIGDRLGYRLTTTTPTGNTESIEFLESGVKLRVTPSIDKNGKIALLIHPEVSNGKIIDQLPTQTTTEVTTHLLADHGQAIFIGGLIKTNTTKEKSSVPLLGDIPYLGRLFSKTNDVESKIETVVIITPYIIRDSADKKLVEETTRLEAAQLELPPDFSFPSKLWGKSFSNTEFKPPH